MNDAEVLENINPAIYHYVKQNGETFTDIKNNIYINNGNFHIKSWPFQFAQPTKDDLKVYTVAEVLSTWSERTFTHYYGTIDEFFKYYHHYLNTRISALEGNPVPTTTESETLLQQIFSDFKSTQ